jgi:homoserine dehydrogenase
MQQTVRLGIVGLGTVGTGVLRMLRKNLPLIERKIGARLEVSALCDRDPRRLKEARTGREKAARDFRDVVGDPSIDIVVELIGGYEPARTVVVSALKKGKHIVTANKALLAKYWDEVFTLASERKLLVYFEAAVGGGIPVIQALNEGLAGNRIEKIVGILNGTTNYILTHMSEEGLDFGTALGAAQKAGFAEPDPTFDVEGTDAAHKLAILASIASGGWVRLEGIDREGIAGLDIRDIRFALDELGYEIKLLGVARNHDGVWEAHVHPTLIPRSHPFSAVRDEYNAIFIHGDAVKDVMFYGKGAGQMPAASAVVSDIIFLARGVANATAGKVPYVTYAREPAIEMLPAKDVEGQYYLRFMTVDKPGVLARIAGVLSKNGVSIASVHQHEKHPQRGVPILIVTHVTRAGAIGKSLAEIDRLPTTTARTAALRIER